MAYGRKYEDSPYAGVGKAYKGYGQRQQARKNDPRNERNRRMADIMRMASQWAPAAGGIAGGAIGGIGGFLAGGGPASLGTSLPMAGTGLAAGIGAGAGLGTAAGAGLQGMANEVTMPEQQAAAEDPTEQMLLRLLMSR